MTATAVRLHACLICGKQQPADRLTYSRFTGSRYCAYDLPACERRAKRAQRKGA